MAVAYLADETRPVNLPAARRKSKHGLSYTRIYRIWKGMISRCESPANASYKNYGAKGTTVCERWRTLDNFIADMGPTYYPGATIDRIYNSRNYEPGNCRWSDMKTQQRHRGTNRLITFEGKTLCMMEWAELLGCIYPRFQRRVRRHGEQESIRAFMAAPRGSIIPQVIHSGERHPHTRVPDSVIEQMLLDLQAGGFRQAVADKYGVTYHFVVKIASGRTRKNVRPDITRPVGRLDNEHLARSIRAKVSRARRSAPSPLATAETQ